MIIVVNHKVNNPLEFWASAEESLSHLPAKGVQRVIQVLPNYDMTEATCVWEADSIESLDKFLHSTIGDWGSINYQEVNTEQAIGLPV